MGNGKGRNRPPPAPAVQVNQKVVREKIKELEDQLDELEGEATPPSNLAMGVQDAASPTNCNVLVRGELKDKGAEVPRGVLTVLKTPQAAHVNPRRSGRLELAHWIASKDNPLTARVMVNRVWEHLFGQGLVDTVDNFGALGNEPSHPDLLDTLAVQFMNDHWSIKKLIRSIVLSRVYQLSSQHNADDYAIDPGNRFLWRMERRRLDAEEIRDAMLLASGQLDLERPEGSPVMELANKQVRPNKESQRSQAIQRAERISASAPWHGARHAASLRPGRSEPDRRQAGRHDRADAGAVPDEQSVRLETGRRDGPAHSGRKGARSRDADRDRLPPGPQPSAD